MKKEEGIITVVLAILCLLAKSSAEETTILIDDFSSATGKVATISPKTYISTNGCSKGCLEQFLCTNQSSSSIPGGIRYSDYNTIIRYNETGLYGEQFIYQEIGSIKVSNKTWESSLNITNNGSIVWKDISFSTTLNYINNNCDYYVKDNSMNLLLGDGDSIAFNIESASSNTTIIKLSLIDIKGNKFEPRFIDSKFDPEIGQYVILMNSTIDFDFSKVTLFAVSALFKDYFVQPNDSLSYYVKISNLRIISTNEETSQLSSQSSLSSKELSSDSSLTNSFFSFYLLFVILFFIN